MHKTNGRALQVFLGVLLAVAVGVIFWAASGSARLFQHRGTPVNLESPLVPSATRLIKNIPATLPGKGYRFVAFGDWGAGTQFQKDVAKQLIALYQKDPYDAVLLLGDNIYEFGDVKKYGKAYFTDTYTPLIQGGVHFITALGNHDVRLGHQDEQVKFFNMPGYYYTVRKPQIEFFVLNTNDFAKDEVQQRWLDKALTDSTAPWKIVMAHHPIYSSGEHNFNPALKKTLEPLLIKHHVDFYLAGHDHDYERFAPINGVQHIVEGGGGAYLRGFSRVMPYSIVRVKAHSFLNFTLDGNTMRMTVIDKTGHIIDQAQWQKVAAKPAVKKAS